MSQALQIAAAFMFGVIVMFLFEVPALTTAINGMNDKNAAIARLEQFCNRPGVRE